MVATGRGRQTVLLVGSSYGTSHQRVGGYGCLIFLQHGHVSNSLRMKKNTAHLLIGRNSEKSSSSARRHFQPKSSAVNNEYFVFFQPAYRPSEVPARLSKCYNTPLFFVLFPRSMPCTRTRPNDARRVTCQIVGTSCLLPLQPFLSPNVRVIRSQSSKNQREFSSTAATE